jgi:UPF0755 protein
MEPKKLLVNVDESLFTILKPKPIAAPCLRKSEHRVKKTSRLIILGLIVPFILFVGGIFWWKSGFSPVDPGSKEKKTFVIPKGRSISQIAEDLEKENLIRNAFHFKVMTYFSGTTKKIQAGSHQLSPSMSSSEIAEALTKGTNDQWVTMVEGLRQEQIGELLAAKGFAVDPKVWQETIKTRKLEGKLFPDSYLFPAGADQETILKIIAKNYEKKVLTGLKEDISKSKLSLEEILTLASIVEREARSDEDRQIVAGILLKRWQNSWPLQVDATIQYAVATPKDWWPKTLTKIHLSTKSPYNTYLYKDLPPGPICNPGLSSIKAVLNLKATPYWFYISAPDGTMHYAQTDEEHAANIQKYLK